MKNHFEFVESPADIEQKDSFFIEVPMNISLKNELLDSLSLAGHFPEYFGRNWDALADCLKDFHWISERKIVIIHRDIPLLHDLKNSKIYLEILAEAVADWLFHSLENSDENKPNTAQTHQLRVTFPISVKESIVEFMRA